MNGPNTATPGASSGSSGGGAGAELELVRFGLWRSTASCVSLLMMKFEGYGVVPGLNGDGLDKAIGRSKDLLK